MSQMDEPPSLLDLPEDVICVLLRYLDATSLYFLAKTCTRLDELIKGHFTLWKRIDARRAPYSRDKINYCLKRIYDDGNTWTRSFMVRGDANETPPKSFFSKLQPFARLTVLAIENLRIDGKKYDARVFPSQLHELSLRRTEMETEGFFRGTSCHFPDLRVLILDECNWLFSSALLPISKYRKLEILSVYKCRSLKNSVAYLSLSSHGFKSLKILDARLSLLGNGLVKAIYKIDSLLALYFQNEDISYQLDYFKRKLELLKGAPPRNFITRDDEFDVSEENWYDYEDTGRMDDIGLLDYLLVRNGQKQEKLPESFLYLDPYKTCTCGFENNQKKINNFGGDNYPGDGGDDNHQIRRYKGKIYQLKDYIRRCRTNTRFRRGLPDDNRTRSPSSLFTNPDEVSLAHPNFVFLNLLNRENENHQQNGNNGLSPNAPQNLEDSSDDDSDEEPPRKVPRTEEPTPGPSGLGHFADSGSSLEGVERDASRPHTRTSPVPYLHELPPLRPPTPHPALAVNDPPHNIFRVYFRDLGVVQVESINEHRKNITVPLQRLSLRGYPKITDLGLKYIRDLDLELLDLTYTNVTIEGIENYLRSHPLCRVVHENYCTCTINLHF